MKSQLYKVILLLIPLFVFSCGDEITDLQKQSFIKFFGGYRNDAGKDVKTLPSGGYALVGSMIPDSISKMALIITDEGGNQIDNSPFFYGGDFHTEGNALLALSDGYLLAGSLLDTAADGELQSDMYLVRVDAGGNEIWSKTFGEDEDDVLFHVIENNTGGYILAGSKTSNEQQDLWVMVVDAEGEKLHEFIGADKDDDDEANFLFRTSTGFICACTYDEGEMEGTDVFLVSFSEDCTNLDSKALGTEDDDYARNIIRFNDGYMVLGYTENSSTGLNEIALYTFSLENGKFKNTDKFASISESGVDLNGERCSRNSDGGVAIIGTAEENDNKDMLLILLNSDGTVKASNEEGVGIHFGGVGNQTGNAIDQSKDGGLVVIGNNALEGNTLISFIKTNASGKL